MAQTDQSIQSIQSIQSTHSTHCQPPHPLLKPIVTTLLQEAQTTTRFTTDYLITLTVMCSCHVADSLFQDPSLFSWTDWVQLLHSVFVSVETQKHVAVLLARVIELGGEQQPWDHAEIMRRRERLRWLMREMRWPAAETLSVNESITSCILLSAVVEQGLASDPLLQHAARVLVLHNSSHVRSQFYLSFSSLSPTAVTQLHTSLFPLLLQQYTHETVLRDACLRVISRFASFASASPSLSLFLASLVASLASMDTRQQLHALELLRTLPASLTASHRHTLLLMLPFFLSREACVVSSYFALLQSWCPVFTAEERTTLIQTMGCSPEGHDVVLSLCQQLEAKEDLGEEDRKRMGKYLCESLDWGMESVGEIRESDG